MHAEALARTHVRSRGQLAFCHPIIHYFYCQLLSSQVEIGLPHCREFTIACVVLKYREVGTGKSKKIAKRQAAQRMWERLQNQTLDQNEVVQSCIDEANDEVRL
jgi:hypothetical protein